MKVMMMIHCGIFQSVASCVNTGENLHSNGSRSCSICQISNDVLVLIHSFKITMLVK